MCDIDLLLLHVYHVCNYHPGVNNTVHNKNTYIYSFGLWFLAVLQLYRGGQFYWWWKPE
jgi:hypothetical protein